MTHYASKSERTTLTSTIGEAIFLEIEPWGNEYKVPFDLNYCSKNREIISQISPCDYEEWVDCIPQIKAEMDAYFHKCPKLEREYQQLVLRENNNST